ncbi:MAG TPA: hypothetical protein VHE30_19150 [Polyangiaceae bacterium]|nr:hypothetical protein [Polyangiaceae bacterium]
MNGVPNRSAILVFLLAAAVMIVEVALTRVFSFVTYHHMTYLVIGVAMLGFGASGTFLTLRPGPSVSRHAALFAAAVVAAVFAIPKVQFHSMSQDHIGDYFNLVVLFPMTVLTAAPFFFAGVCIAELISTAGAGVNFVYFADLVGSAAGAVAAVLLVNGAGAIAACVLAAALAFGAAALAAERNRLSYVALALGVAALAPLGENPAILPLHVPPGKQLYGAEDAVELTEWHVITRLDITHPLECNCSFGGALSPAYDDYPPLVRLIYQDGSNLTGIIHPTPTPENTPVLGYYLQGAAYRVRPGASALVIGSGGGVDVMIGLHHGASHVVAVDVNPKTMRFVTGPLSKFAGDTFDGKRVEPIVSEGRHFLGRDHRTFDVIQVSGVDTWAAQAAGAYALTENFIYTAEAFDQYLAHLRPDGILGFSRPYANPPLETFRLVSTAEDALERLGATDAARHLFIAAGHGQTADVPWAEVLIKRSPFTEDEVNTLRRWTEQRRFDVVHDPFHAGESALGSAVSSSHETREKFLRGYPLEVGPVTDDAPFYFQYHHWKDLFGASPLGLPPPAAMWILLGSFLQVLLLSALLILYPLYRAGSGAAARGGRIGLFFYFGSLGLGFILVEVALLQKLSVFLGGPAYAMAITLFTLLAASGTGSLVSQRAARDPLRLMGRVTPLLAVGIVGLAFALDFLMPRCMGLSMPGRIAVATALITPLGLLMGTLFPAGLRHVDETRPELKPWAWGINACATVVGTATCMIVVTSVGFRGALLAGAAVYALGFAVLAASARAKPVAPG